jgi:hypothetical protein
LRGCERAGLCPRLNADLVLEKSPLANTSRGERRLRADAAFPDGEEVYRLRLAGDCLFVAVLVELIACCLSTLDLVRVGAVLMVVWLLREPCPCSSSAGGEPDSPTGGKDLDTIFSGSFDNIGIVAVLLFSLTSWSCEHIEEGVVAADALLLAAKSTLLLFDAALAELLALVALVSVAARARIDQLNDRRRLGACTGLGFILLLASAHVVADSAGMMFVGGLFCLTTYQWPFCRRQSTGFCLIDECVLCPFGVSPAGPRRCVEVCLGPCA